MGFPQILPYKPRFSGWQGIRMMPRMQAGLQYSPAKTVDVDVIYGHNLTVRF
jgi:hypothetical protein